jgi:hypothetical protein
VDKIADIVQTRGFTDTGVFLGHHATQYRDQRLQSTREVSVSELTRDPLTALAGDAVHIPKTNVESSELRFDPLARELYAPTLYARGLETNDTAVRTFVKSEIDVHERSHAAEVEANPHLYHRARLLSFEWALAAACRTKDSPISLSRNDLPTESGGLANDVNLILKSELVQEAIALRRQQHYLQQADIPDSLLDQIDYRATIERGLENETGAINDHVSADGAPIHSFAHWLADEASQQWEIDVLQYASKFVNATGAPTLPDPVLAIAMSIDRETITACTADQQLDLLATAVSNHASVDGDRFVFDGDRDGSTPSSVETVTAQSVMNDFRQGRLKRFYDRGLFCFVPLFASCYHYPGVSDGQSLPAILNALYATTTVDGEGQPIVRRLYLDPSVAKWAYGTELLELALDLWELRKVVYFPPLRRLSQQSTAQWSVIETAQAIRNNTRFKIPAYREELVQTANLLEHTIQSFDTERLKDTIEDLTTLGEAIIHEDETTVRSYL